VRYAMLHMNNGTIFEDIQTEFSGLYPFLKIEFFRYPDQDWNTNVKTRKINPQERLSRFLKEKECENFDMGDTRTVQELTEHFEKVFGLSVSILRKTGNVWVETILTPGWTLKQQNREGELISLISGSH
jgi:glycerol-3-phosphate O-acyltransferase